MQAKIVLCKNAFGGKNASSQIVNVTLESTQLFNFSRGNIGTPRQAPKCCRGIAAIPKRAALARCCPVILVASRDDGLTKCVVDLIFGFQVPRLGIGRLQIVRCLGVQQGGQFPAVGLGLLSESIRYEAECQEKKANCRSANGGERITYSRQYSLSRSL